VCTKLVAAIVEKAGYDDLVTVLRLKPSRYGEPAGNGRGRCGR
jgi:hypothetical protein